MPMSADASVAASDAVAKKILDRLLSVENDVLILQGVLSAWKYLSSHQLPVDEEDCILLPECSDDMYEGPVVDVEGGRPVGGAVREEAVVRTVYAPEVGRGVDRAVIAVGLSDRCGERHHLPLPSPVEHYGEHCWAGRVHVADGQGETVLHHGDHAAAVRHDPSLYRELVAEHAGGQRCAL